MISYEETIKLVALAQEGNDEAKEKLINENYPLVKSVIRRYRGKGVEYEDLFQLGCVGFVKAINNFDPKFNVRFSTYAVPLIAGEVKRFLRDDGYIKVSRAIKTQASQINKYIASCTSPPSITEIATHFKLDPQEVVFIMDSTKYPVSLSTPIDSEDGEGITIEEKLADSSQEDKFDHVVLKSLITRLSPKERKIIIMRYYKDKTQNEIAKMLGVSQVQVSRIENKILSTLKKQFFN
ncbi:MAG: SigB/SigF/SigG family RNA polymerase sigma factor [Clostridia bacterium]|nr:SigB/SigF/SigG family RNA polymerase sigma factor [Clostridia bacterium]